MHHPIERNLPGLECVVVLEPRGRGKEGPREHPRDVRWPVHQQGLSRIDTCVTERARQTRRHRDADTRDDGRSPQSSVVKARDEPRRKRGPERFGDNTERPSRERPDAPALGLVLESRPVELGREPTDDRIDIRVPEHAREVGAERQVKHQMQEQVLRREHQARAVRCDERTRPSPEPVVVDLDDPLEAQVARDVPVQVDPRPVPHELGEAS
jgi:hypothetical protein